MYSKGQIQYPPAIPEHYFGLQERAILLEYQEQIERFKRKEIPLPAFPSKLVTLRLDNTWHDTAEAVVGNWMGCIYQVTHSDRKYPFMEGVNPNDPLGLAR